MQAPEETTVETENENDDVEEVLRQQQVTITTLKPPSCESNTCNFAGRTKNYFWKSSYVS